MKELSIEDKAKRYNEALERARKLENKEPLDVSDGTSIPVAIFPELAELNDNNARIKKGIIKFIMDLNTDWLELHGVTKEEAIAWLKKQGKQKSSWSVEDELMLKDAIEFIETGWSDKGKSHLVYWLKSLKQRIGE